MGASGEQGVSEVNAAGLIIVVRMEQGAYVCPLFVEWYNGKHVVR